LASLSLSFFSTPGLDLAYDLDSLVVADAAVAAVVADDEAIAAVVAVAVGTVAAGFVAGWSRGIQRDCWHWLVGSESGWEFLPLLHLPQLQPPPPLGLGIPGSGSDCW